MYVGHTVSATTTIPVSSTTTPATTTATSTVTTTTPTVLDDFPLLQAIRRGQALLQADLKQPTDVTRSIPDWAPVQLAVWHSASDTIDVIKLEKHGSEVRGNDPRIDAVNVLLSRQLQSQFTLADQADVVVAIRYPLYHKVTIKKKKRYQREDVIYTPYSPMIDTPDMIRFGQAWLDGKFQAIADDLRARGVKSKFDPSKLIADTMPVEVARAILVIEHTSRASLERSAAQTYAQMLVTVAANGTSSYAYDDSNVGAQGFAQFMPSTYKLVAKDASLGLPSDVQTGTRSFETAVKAELVYLDRLWAVMPDEAKAMQTKSPDEAAEFIVAAYNGGEGRVQKAVALWGDTWSTPDVSQVKQATSAVKTATSAVKLAKRSVSAAKTAKTKSLANAKLKKAKTTLANAESTLAHLQAGTLRTETIDYVAKFREALRGIRQVTNALQTGTTLTMTDVAPLADPSATTSTSASLTSASTSTPVTVSVD